MRGGAHRGGGTLAGGSVCIVLLTGLGDVVMGLPVACALKRHFPGIRVTWVAESMPASVLHGHPAVDDVVVYRKDDGFRGIRALRAELGARRFDVTLNLNYYFKSVWPTVLSRAPRRVGFDWSRSRDGTWFATNEHLSARPRAHTVDMLLEFLEHLAVPREPVEWGLEPTAAERRSQVEFLARHGDRPLVAVVPTSSMERKDWPADRYVPVVDHLQETLGYRALLLGGPGGRETGVARRISRAAATEPIWGMGDGVRRLVWMLDLCSLVIAPDTGPVHIARALDVPVIGLYGHTNPWRVGPYRRFQDLWIDAYSEPNERPDPSLAAPRHDRMIRIEPEQVIERIAQARELYPRARETVAPPEPASRTGEDSP